MTIATVSSTLPATATSSGSAASSSAGSSTQGPTATASSALVAEAVTLSTDADVASTLNGAAPLTYNAQGLLNSFLQASQTSSPAASGNSTSASSDGSVPSTGSSSSTTSPTGLDSSWAQILQKNPALTGAVSNDLLNQSLVNAIA